METILNFIDGKHQPALSGETVANYNPATGQIYGSIPASNTEDVELAVSAAKKAFPKWSSTSLKERSRIILRLSELIQQNLERFALAETTDNGKPLWLSRSVDIPRAVENFHFYGTALLHTHSETYDMGNLGFNYTLRRPIGVAGLISPWNLPLYLFSWKIAPALAAGNTIVAKPSEVTPMTAYLLSELCNEAGFPPGVVNIIHGTGPKAGAAIVAHPNVPVISFTGGTATGAALAAVAAPMFKKLSLELGGKNPTIVFSDCDYEDTLQQTVRAAFTNQGQICLCGS
ncbi:MAG: aldehyde dehydrogenase family protein, partial [Bacteroidia bacterium]|nr:aldehyde dehydrogenase family protein [Bacteroidia bacterium]